jgi:hypothetical protein
MSHSGFDKYLEFQFRWTGDFYTLLFQVIGCADEGNLGKIAAGFPSEVEAYKTWTRIGQEAFLAKCDPKHPLMEKIRKGELGL